MRADFLLPSTANNRWSASERRACCKSVRSIKTGREDGGSRRKGVSMVVGATEAVGQGKGPEAGSSLRGTRKVRGQTNGVEEQRFFLAKPGGNHGAPEFSKEVPRESEAMGESLKTGLSYFVVSERSEERRVGKE